MKQMSPPQCQIYLFLTVGVAAAFFLATVVFVIVVLAKKRRELTTKTIVDSPATSTSSVNIHPVCRPGEDRAENSKVIRNPNRGIRDNLFYKNSSNMESNQSITSDSEEEHLQMPWMPQVFVPATVRQRKRQVNHELIDTFNNGPVPMASCPPLMNYYGYMVVPTKAASTGYNTGDRTKRSRKRNRSGHSTLDRKIDPSMFSCSDNDESFSEFDDVTTHKSHRDIYKRRQLKYSERSRSRDRKENNMHRSEDNRSRNVSHIKIEGPPPPPQRPLPRISKFGSQVEEHFYETPVDNRPVMV